MSEENVIAMPTPTPCPYCQQDCAPESVRCSGCGCPLRLDPSFTPEELRGWAQKLRERAAEHKEHAQELREYVERRQ